MNRLVAFSLIVSLIFSLAAPYGAVFADDGAGLEELVYEQAANVEPVANLDSPRVAESLVKEEQSAVESMAVIAPTPELVVTPKILSTEPPTELLSPQRKVFVSAFQASDSLSFIELYNSDTKTQAINSWRLEVEFTDNSKCTSELEGYIFSKTKVMINRGGGLTQGANAKQFICDEAAKVAMVVSLYDGDQLIERLVPPIGDTQVWIRKNTTATYLTGSFTQDFRAFDVVKDTVVDGYWYDPPVAPEIKILEIVTNPRPCLTPDEATDCYDFVKVKNISVDPIDLQDYRLRSGFSNSSASSSNTENFDLTLQPGEVRTLTHNISGNRVSFTANDGTLWFEDAEGMVTYPTLVPAYVGSGLDSKKDMSWALDLARGEWRWGLPSPDFEDNYFPPDPVVVAKSNTNTLVPCAAHQFRSPETNRCNNIAAVNTLTPCRDGQYRSEETNRCRSVATVAASVLKPCADDQFRNPETNRCKKIASVDELADCGEGRERNPETNRCRNVLSSTMPVAGFAPEVITETATSMMGWWVAGGVSLVAVGYGIWQWRFEISRFTKRTASFFTSKSK